MPDETPLTSQKHKLKENLDFDKKTCNPLILISNIITKKVRGVK